MAKPPFAAQITLEYTLQQDTNRGVEDVRSGMSNAAERRKEQNRVHQKAWRIRKKLERSQFRIVKYPTDVSNSSSGQKLAPSEISSSGSSGSLEDSSLMVRATGQHFSHSHSDITAWQEVDLLNVFNSAAGLSQIKTCERSRTAVACAQGNLGDSIDCLPVPQMRQNLIPAGNTYDVMDLCGDLVGLFSAGTGRTGMVIWGEPWDVAGWEVTEGFLERWGWTIKGCWDLFESTNRWRAERGQMALQFDKVLI
ncbi:hypothetical protein EAE99_011329 [Botrytis elliptica]|nr:hypothetical protein EAE99_011329 [Botrytis elliptica]